MELSLARRALIERLKRRKSREREGMFLVEGVRAVAEGLERWGDVRFAVRSNRLDELAGGTALAKELDRASVDVHRLDDADFDQISDTESPQGVLLVCGELRLEVEEVLSSPGRGLLVLDGVQDPGNVGALIRCAAAFGLRGVVALDGTADPWGSKAVRASAGGVFATRICRADWVELAPALSRRGIALGVADPRGVEVSESVLGRNWALAVGNEGVGCREALRAVAASEVGIRMAPGFDSLNVGVAGAILLHALSRDEA